MTQIVGTTTGVAASWLSFEPVGEEILGTTGIAVLDDAASAPTQIATATWKQGGEHASVIVGLTQFDKDLVYSNGTELHIVDNLGAEISKVALRFGNSHALQGYAGGVVVAEQRDDQRGTHLVHYALNTGAAVKPTLSAGQVVLETSDELGIASAASVASGRLLLRTDLVKRKATPFTTVLRAEYVGDLWVGPPAALWAANRGAACLAPYAPSPAP